MSMTNAEQRALFMHWEALSAIPSQSDAANVSSSAGNLPFQDRPDGSPPKGGPSMILAAHIEGADYRGLGASANDPLAN
jgi:hypothetical protein